MTRGWKELHNEELHQISLGLSNESQELGGTYSRPAKEDECIEYFICLV
jgi:hypothetical protein